MKVKFEDNKIIIYLQKTFIANFDIKDETKLEAYFKDLFLKLKKRYSIEINGYFDIDVYTDKNYGVILEIENLDVDYYQYFSQIDMKINILKDSSFLYEIDYENLCDKNYNYYKIKDKIYIEVNEDISSEQLGNILEYATIIYGEKKDEIIKYGKKVRL